MRTPPSIVVLDGRTLNPGDNPWDAVAALGNLTVHEAADDARAVERARDADIVLTNKSKLPAGVLERLPRLRYISVLATGHDVVDSAAAGQLGIPVSNVPGYAAESVAEFVLAQILALARAVSLHDARVRAGEWNRRGDFCFWDTPQVELAGLTLGVVGFGAIGRRVAELARAFGMRVLAYAPRPKPPLPGPNFAFAGIEELLEASDVVSLHCPLTPANEGFVNRDFLSAMKPGAFLVNTARGRLVNEADLARALDAGRLAGAALDVLAVEPPTPDNPLLRAKNCLLTPHMAWASLTARRRLMAATAENVRSFLAGSPVNVVNAASLTPRA